MNIRWSIFRENHKYLTFKFIIVWFNLMPEAAEIHGRIFFLLFFFLRALKVSYLNILMTDLAGKHLKGKTNLNLKSKQ